MTTAAFSITGSTSGASPSTDAGFDAVTGETLTFALEASPGVDVRSTLFEVVSLVPAATASLALSGSGIPPTPLGDVTATVLDGFAAYLVRCTINGGVNADGSANADWIRERIVVVRRGGVRPVIPGERTQYDTDAGWFEAMNTLLEGASAAGKVRRVDNVSPSGGSVNITLTDDLADGETALIAFVVWGQDAGGDRAWYRGTVAVARTAGVASAIGSIALQLTAEEDAGWGGPTAIADASGQAALTVSGDGSDLTLWLVTYSYIRI